MVSTVGEERGIEVQPGLTDLEPWDRNNNIHVLLLCGPGQAL